LNDFNTGINTAQICGGIPVFGIPGYRYWRPYLQVTYDKFSAIDL